MDIIRERKILLNLSDSDCKSLSELCGKNNLTINELLEGFIGDLIDGTHTNGSDERDLAEQWFDRRYILSDETLLSHLLDWGYEPEEYIDLLECIEEAEEDIKKAKEHPEEYDEEELSFIEGDIEVWEEDLKDMRKYWKPNSNIEMDKEINNIKKWIKEREDLLK